MGSRRSQASLHQHVNELEFIDDPTPAPDVRGWVRCAIGAIGLFISNVCEGWEQPSIHTTRTGVSGLALGGGTSQLVRRAVPGERGQSAADQRQALSLCKAIKHFAFRSTFLDKLEDPFFYKSKKQDRTRLHKEAEALCEAEKNKKPKTHKVSKAVRRPKF